MFTLIHDKLPVMYLNFDQYIPNQYEISCIKLISGLKAALSLID